MTYPYLTLSPIQTFTPPIQTFTPPIQTFSTSYSNFHTTYSNIHTTYSNFHTNKKSCKLYDLDPTTVWQKSCKLYALDPMTVSRPGTELGRQMMGELNDAGFIVTIISYPNKYNIRKGPIFPS